jgi:uncharacterized glyoxalase superfamily protein PhnB
MPVLAKHTKATVIPCLQYRDASKALEWLCQTFGFEKQLVIPLADGSIMHAQLSLGNGMIMLSSVPEEKTEFGSYIKQPDQTGSFEMQSFYIIVSDADEIYNRVIAAGAEIIIDIKDEDYGSRGFSCMDLEGHLWSIGTYNPWWG